MRKKILEYNNHWKKLMQLMADKVNQISPDFIYGLPRGGLPIAVHLSHWCPQSKIILTPDDIPAGDKTDKKIYTVAVVDDIIDSGESFLKAYDAFENVMRFKNVYLHLHFFAVYKSCRLQKSYPLYFEWLRFANKDEWIVFPWEHHEAKTVKDNTI